MEKTSLYKKYFLESLNVRKNSKGLMGSKTRVHKDKKKESTKKLGRKRIESEDENTVGGGALGPAAASGNTQGDFYATGDARMPGALGGKIQKRNLPGLTMNLSKGNVFSRNKKRRKNKKKK
tara:strand:+ start:2933 stop:3298 length:366 start_codon:yes stop_codon:yes gene_type:complete